MIYYCKFLAVFLCAIVSYPSIASIVPEYLRVEYKINPFVEEAKPRLSWELKGDGFNQSQSAYHILVASSENLLEQNIGDVWDSGKILSNQTNQIEYAGNTLKSGQKLWWKVRTWDQNNNAGDWSTINFWEMGMLNPSDWKAAWIGYNLNDKAPKGEYDLPPSPYLRKESTINKPIQSARLYISSLGLHDFYVNGNKIGNDYFASGWTEYNKRVYYNVYDITKELKAGNNAFAAVLGSGWYAGYLGYALLVGTKTVNRFYGEIPLLKAQIEIKYTDGTSSVVATDKTWKATEGAIREADFLQGEFYDATKEIRGWNKPNFNDNSWKPVQVYSDKAEQKMQIYPSNPVRVFQELKSKDIRKIADEKYIIDFGQNFAGNIRLKVKGNKGDTITFRYGEMCYPDGSLMTENLRRARAKDTYILKGDPNGEIWSPSFTFHGFQFVEVAGLKQKPTKDFLTGLVLTSDLNTVGHFESNNQMLNQLYSNIVWTQRANYIDIPTDCPQRDERLGWTGDAQVYMRSAAFNADIAPFHKKWIRDLNDAQWPSGAYPVYAPNPINSKGESAIRASDTFSPGWSEAGIICTYEIFRAYDDRRIVKESMNDMVRFMDFLKQRTKDGILIEGSFEDVSPKGGFADWLSIGKKASPDMLATIYYFYCNKLMYEMAVAIDDLALAERFKSDLNQTKVNFKKHYMADDGRLVVNEAFYGDGAGYVDGSNGFSGHTQTSYANALYAGILNEEDIPKAAHYLRLLVEQNGDKLTTGFLGFKPLLPALSASGSSDKAYALILSTEYPSLGYEVVNGATSIWERWDSYKKGEGFMHNAAMNSFSHYAYGAVNEWIFENMIGIKSLENGFKRVKIKPEIPLNGINSVKGSYRSMAGLISSSWNNTNSAITQEIGIPVNVIAEAYIPSEATNILINGLALDKSPLVRSISNDAKNLIIELGSGKYTINFINQ